jgi:hypothetical protein
MLTTQTREHSGKAHTMTRQENYFQNMIDRIKEAQESGETDTPLGGVLAKWDDLTFPIWNDGKWLLEGFIMDFKKRKEILSAIDPTVSPDLPSHLLDPAQVISFLGLPLEDFNWSPGQITVEGSGRPEEYGEPPQEVGTARAAEILGVSKDTVLKLKAAGLLEYRNMAPPESSRPIFAFTVRSVMELRTSYEREEPTPPMSTSQSQRRRAAQQNKKYKHVKLED